MLLTVSIVLHDPDQNLLVRTLSSLSRSCSEASKFGWIRDARVVLMDHSPLPAMPELISSWQRVCGMDVEYFHNPGNPGFGAGHNAIFRSLASTDFFLVANPDLEFDVTALTAGLAFLAAHPETGVIAPGLIEKDALRPACFRSPDFLTLGMRAFGLDARHSQRIARYECRDWDASRPVFAPTLMSGCCLLFRADAFERLGGFDPNYFLYFEDFDLTRRAARLGLSAYCPAMRVKHAGGGASRKGVRQQMYFLRSAWRFFATHGWRG